MNNKKHTLQDSIDEVRAVREVNSYEIIPSKVQAIKTMKKHIKRIDKAIDWLRNVDLPDNTGSYCLKRSLSDLSSAADNLHAIISQLTYK